MNINKTKVGVILVITLFFLICSISSSSASMEIVDGKNIVITNQNDSASNIYASLSANKNVYSIDKNKVNKKWKLYENDTFQVAKNRYIKYKGSMTQGITKSSISYIDFGDGTKKKGYNWITHKYKKTGWYKLKVTFNATFTDFSLWGVTVNGKIYNATKTYLVKVTDAPQLSLGSYQPITVGYANKGTIYSLVIKVANVGSKTSKATKISMWYQKSGDKNIGKIHPKLKKYTASAKLKALKPGKSTKIILRFKIPKKYSKIVKNLRLGTSSLKQISKRDALYVIN